MAFKYTVQPTDTAGLNSIVKRYGFANYQAAGITSVPSGNVNLIRPGDVIDIPNYEPNKITPIKPTSPVVSSSDGQQEYRNFSTKLDKQLGSLGPLFANVDKIGMEGERKIEKVTTGEGAASTGDTLLDKMNKREADDKAKYEAQTLQRKEEHDALFKTSLANIDASANATIENIKISYDKRLKEQARLNELDVARVKAYGLGHGGQYTPISFGDAVTLREQAAADKISSLENERNALISKAEAAREEGRIGLLRQNMEDLDRINNQLRENLKFAADESEKQYRLLRDLRKEEEAKHEKEVEKMKVRLAAIAPRYADEYASLDEEGKDKFIDQLARQTGLDFATVYGVVQSAYLKTSEKTIQSSRENAIAGVIEQGIKEPSKILDILNFDDSGKQVGDFTMEEVTKYLKSGADIEAQKALTEQRRASIAKTYADAAIKSNEKKMQNEIPPSFQSDADFQKKKREFVKKYGVDGQKYWDAIFINPATDEYEYDKVEGAPKSIEERAKAAGYDYKIMKKEGSDEEIDKFLKSKGF